MYPRPRGMATAAMAGAAGAAVVLYYTGWGNPWGVFGRPVPDDPSVEENSEEGVGNVPLRGNGRLAVMPRTTRAPSTWFEALSTLSETLRFTYAETLGKWPIGDLAFGINYLLKRQGHLHVAGVYAGEENQQLHGLVVLTQMRELLRLLTVCMHFSKKPFPLFLEIAGYTNDQVLLQEGKAGLLKPAFTVLVDHESHCILLLVRGTHSVRDTLTAVTGAIVPFHHTVLGDAGVNSLVLGYAHCGMVAAARWIAQLSTSHILQALKEYPMYSVKVVGHSLGGGTAALLTYILREREAFSSTHCVCFAPAACMTWELAESGRSFVTTVINGSDLVPCFSPASLDDLRAEVTASAWVKDFQEQIERTRILRTVYRSATALGSRLQSIASLSRASLPYSSLIVSRAAQTGAAGAGAIWRPVSSGTQIVMRQAQTAALAVVRRPSLAGWSCMGPRRRETCPEDPEQTASASHLPVDKEKGDKCIVADETQMHAAIDADCLPTSYLNFDGDGEEQARAGNYWQRFKETRHALSCQSDEAVQDLPSLITKGRVPDDGYRELQSQDEQVDEEEGPMGPSGIGEEYLWQQLAEELQRQQDEGQSQLVREEEEAAAREIIQEEEHVASKAASELGQDHIVSEEQGPVHDLRRFFPPGRLMHIVSPLPDEEGNLGTESEGKPHRVRLFSTERSLYGKVRLSRTMVHDHFMPTYKQMMESVIEVLETEICDSNVEDTPQQQVDEQTQVMEKAM